MPVIGVAQGVGGLSALAFRNSTPANGVLSGAIGLLAGVAVTVGGIEAPSTALFLVGTAIAGVGFGVAFLGEFRILSAMAPAAERARLVATIYVVCYLSFSIPAVIAGVVIVLLTGVGSLSALAFRNSTPANGVLSGAVGLLAGVAVTVGGIEAPSTALFLVGTAIAGVGFGVAFLGEFRILSAMAPAAERARLVATIYVVCYLSFSIPAVIAGVVATDSGLHDASLGYAAFVGALSALAAASAVVRRTSHKRHSGRLGVHDLPPTPCATPMTGIQIADREALASASSSR